MQNYNVAICLLTCEIGHFEEWYNHHKERGFENFLIFADENCIELNNIDKALLNKIPNIKIISRKLIEKVKPNQGSILNLLYTYVCRQYDYYDYILFIDSDEYYMSKTNNIIKDLNFLKELHGDFDGLGLYWRNYGAQPAFEDRAPISLYRQWYKAKHFKSLVNPKSVQFFLNPHVAKGNFKKYIYETGKIVKQGRPYNNNHHSSNYVWIKHVMTRSKSEFSNKINRGTWYQKIHQKRLHWNWFNTYNSKCKNED